MLKEITRLCFYFFIFFLSSCGFTVKTHNLPPSLRILSLETANPKDPLSVELGRTLTAMGIKIADTSPTILYVSDVTWDKPIPSIVYSGNAIQLTYILNASFSLITGDKKIRIGKKHLTITKTLTQNVNQVYVPEAFSMLQREMIHEMAILIANQLFIIPQRSKSPPPHNLPT